jgi:hypothetical protein
MKKYMILGVNMLDGYDHYRGTYRTEPSYIEELPEDHEVNVLFWWFMEKSGEDGIVSDKEKAIEMVETYRKLTPPQIFEVVRLLKVKERPPKKEEFLGYDISCGYGTSLLAWELDIVTKGKEKEKVLRQISPLTRLVKEHFKPLLNKNCLFNDSKTAQFCLDCMMALQDIRPGLFENEEMVFEVVGLSKVY